MKLWYSIDGVVAFGRVAVLLGVSALVDIWKVNVEKGVLVDE